jgi:RNA polymerase sigma-70 factor (ECF subfamily)
MAEAALVIDGDQKTRLRLVSSRDDTAFYEDLRRHVQRAVGRLCPSWLRNEQDDIVQLAMIRLYNLLERETAEGIGRASASYVWKTAFSVTVDEIRRRSRRPETPLGDDEAAIVVPDAAPDPEQNAMARELGEMIRGCLARLADERRAAVVLHLQGHTVGQVAALLGWSAKRAENLVYRGLADLRRCLASKGVGGK